MQSKRTPASRMALGGILAAAAVLIMSMGTLIPVATYTCPMLCTLLTQAVLRSCGKRVAWAWYGAVALLGLLLAPDKEAAAVFAFLGYYPIVKPRLEASRGKWLWKALLFNGSILLMYRLLMGVLGVDAVLEDFSGLDTAMTAVLLVLGNVTFFLLDLVLSRGLRWRKP